MELCLLGPVEVKRGGQPLAVGGPRQRALLAFLALRGRRAARIDQIVAAVWGDEPPANPAGTVQTAISRLRSTIGDDGTIVLHSGGAYRLDVDRIKLDTRQFEELVAAGRAVRTPGEGERLLGEALRLFRGPALADVQEFPFAAVEAATLEDRRLTVVEDRINVRLAAGTHRELVAELERLVDEHPLRERLWAQLMLALYRSQRQADALDAYRRARRRLVDDIGVEPGRELRRLHEAILEQDPALDLADTSGSTVAPVTAPAVTGLPAPSTTFYGRHEELAAIDRMLDTARLLTLAGPGGSGKTRLALEAAMRRAPRHAAGVRFVELAELREADEVHAAVGQVIGVPETTSRPLLEAIVAVLAQQDLLLVLDTCEHVADACAQLTTALNEGCPRLRVIATSRQPLGTGHEQRVAVEPLDLPAEGAGLDAIAASTAVQLFTDRASLALPSFALSMANATDVATICRRLDGIPLALEMAAALTRVVDPDQLAARLDERLEVLRAAGRAPERHRTLREVVAWSYELLEPEEQHLLQRLGAFAGGCSLEAVEEVCAGDGLDPTAVLPALGRLVDHSLLSVRAGQEGRRYVLLDTIRDYARERAEATGELTPAQRRHAAYYWSLADTAAAALHGPDQQWWADLLSREHDNLRAALRWTFAHDEETGLRLVGALAWYWFRESHVQDSRTWVDAALARLPDGPPELTVPVLVAGQLRFYLAGDLPRALSLGEAALDRYEEMGDAGGQAHTTWVLSHLRLLMGDLASGEALAEVAVRKARAASSAHVEGRALATHGFAALVQGDPTRAVALLDDGLCAAEAAGDVWGLGFGALMASKVHLELGDFGRAADLARRSLQLASDMGHMTGALSAMHLLGGALGASGAAEQGARLICGSEHYGRAFGMTPTQVEMGGRSNKELVAERLDPDELSAACAEGEAMRLEELVAYALSDEPCG